VYLCGIEFGGPDYVILYFQGSETLGDAIADVCKSPYPDDSCKPGGNPVTQRITAGLDRQFWSDNTNIATFLSNNGPASTWRGGPSLGSTDGWAELSSSSFGSCDGSAPISNGKKVNVYLFDCSGTSTTQVIHAGWGDLANLASCSLSAD
jgi:hypothetical protein